jgi:hypothetical protein
MIRSFLILLLVISALFAVEDDVFSSAEQADSITEVIPAEDVNNEYDGGMIFKYKWKSDEVVDTAPVKKKRFPFFKKKVTDRPKLSVSDTKNIVEPIVNVSNSSKSVKKDPKKDRLHFVWSADFAFLLEGGGWATEFGPATQLGLRKRGHYWGANFNWGVDGIYKYASCYGGGLEYQYQFNLKDIFKVGIGATAGVWYEQHWKEEFDFIDYEYYDEYYSDIFFGGPKVNFQFGYKHLFLKTECTLLLGTGGIKPILCPGKL